MEFIRLCQILLVAGFCLRVFLADCPRLCECKWKGGKESVICFSANLSVVPAHLDAGTQILDLTSNNLVAIRHDEFSEAGLVNLQKVYVSKCRLKTIDRYAFRNLINLVDLDLSYNALAAVPSHALDSIPELRELKLNGNPIHKVGNDAFIHVGQLVRLEISDCRLSAIGTRAFKGLDRSLEWLKLDKNRLVDVGASALTILENLHGLELAGNPWNCSCGLRPLREWMVRRNVPYDIPPVCAQPKRLATRAWDKLDLDEFACVPEIFAYDSRAHGIEGRNVTMTCRITGIPEPNVRWMLRNKVIANLSGAPTTNNGKKLYIVHLENSSSDLTILAADVQDAGVYVCAAENKAGRVEASVTLAVSRKPPDASLGSKALLISVIAAMLFVLSVCLVSLCVFTLRKKDVNRWRGRTCRAGDADDYEKIEMGRKTGDGLNGRVATGELALVSRKNGDYRVVPGADTDQEEDDADANGDAKRQQRETPFWNPPERIKDTKIDTQWDSGDGLMDNQEDLHIPRRAKLSTPEPRDDLMKNPSLTSGTYSAYQLPSTSAASGGGGRVLPSLPLAQHPHHQQQRGKTKEPHVTYTAAGAPTFGSDLASLLEGDERKYPDLIENSPNRCNNNFAPSKANSEGGINELFCTLPRKRALLPSSRYTSTDSQSPLLPDSRYASSGGESSSSSSRRLSDPHKYPNLNKTRLSHSSQGRSSSYLNLTVQRTSGPHSPIQEREVPLNSTPLLDVASLESRIAIAREPSPSISQPPMTNLNTYDYHAAQLERFLEEYRTLQKELTRMKETCDNMRQDKYLDPMHNSLPVSPSSSELKPTSPNSNNSNNSAPLSSVNNFDSDLSRYLLKSSPKTMNNSGLFNN